jgi:hypothetical protein
MVDPIALSEQEQTSFVNGATNHADNTGRKHLLSHGTHMGNSSKHLELENVENIQIVYAGAL